MNESCEYGMRCLEWEITPSFIAKGYAQLRALNLGLVGLVGALFTQLSR